jgi:V/A-type H+-transporting ATPase subunit I
MTRISVTGSKAVMDDVIETMHELQLLHITDYDGSWEGFRPGDPIEGADETSSKLVTVRALENVLDIDETSVEPVESVDLDDADTRLEQIREEANELDDRRDELESDLRDVEDRLDQMALFADLGLDLDLLWGYDSLDVLVGEGNPTQIEQSLASEDVENFEVFSGTNSVAAFADMAADADIDDALVGVPFTAYEVPEETGDPASNVEELERKHQQIEAELGKVENELEALKHDSKAFLVALERQLTVDVQKAEAPLRFATTARSFIVEGWISSSRVSDLEAALQDAVGNRVDVDERETAEYNDHGHAEHTDHHDEELTADGGEPVASEGSYEPPVVQDNPDTAKPFESLVTMINRPNYDELDPTFIVFLTYPLAFGFMIGDMGYGLMYMLMGYGMYKAFDSEVIKSLGVIGIWAGLFTVVFGYLYDDIFGVHTSELGIEWLPLAGSFHKGLSPVHLDWALLWIVISIVFGVLHLNLGFIFGFINDRSHGIWDAFTENLSWLVMVNGFFVWVFSEHLVGQKPEFIVGDASALEHFFGFTGLPEVVGLVGLGGFAVGIGLALIGEGGLALIETVTVTLANTLSYLRLVAVLLAKAGMAFVVNLLVFGAYSETKSQNGEEVEKIIFNLPTEDVSGLSQEFVGLAHIDPVFVGIPAALLIFVFGHILVLLLGITAAGIQMLRLEYVEFFGKFYEGGGEKFQPFGRQRTHTEDNS